MLGEEEKDEEEEDEEEEELARLLEEPLENPKESKLILERGETCDEEVSIFHEFLFRLFE